MITKEITIGGQPVTICYCYATELSYKKMAGEDISGIINEVIKTINSKEQTTPDLEKLANLITSAILAYYSSKGEEEPFKSSMQVITSIKPKELGLALGHIINMWAEFYEIPADEPKEKKTKGGRKKN
jgi:hypothetical protein